MVRSISLPSMTAVNVHPFLEKYTLGKSMVIGRWLLFLTEFLNAELKIFDLCLAQFDNQVFAFLTINNKMSVRCEIK